MTTYDPRTFDMKNHVDVSVFLNDSSVCEGYAKASAGKEMTVDGIIGDYNFDGKTDARDAAAVLTKYSVESVE
jgi:hypothetical protein